MEYAVALLVLGALVALVVIVPLRRPEAEPVRDEGRIQELQAAKEAKYREIRDAELDHRMGKLSEEDWRGLDRELRAEAIDGPSGARPPRGAPGRRLSAGGAPGGLPLPFPAVEAILSGVQVILAVVLIVLILLHSGKDTGLSGAFGVGTGAGPFGGGSLVERNLNRWTVGFALLFVANVIALLKV